MSREEQSQLQTATHVYDRTTEFLSHCPSDIYVVVQQPQVNAVDYATSRAAPHLRREMDGRSIVAKTNIAKVSGSVSTDSIQQYIEKLCGAKTVDADAFSELYTFNRNIDGTNVSAALGETSSEGPIIVRVEFKAPSQEKSERSIELAENGVLHIFCIHEYR